MVVGVGSNAVDFCLDRLILIVQRNPLRISDRARRRLGGQRDRAIQKRAHLGQRSISHLQRSYTVVRVAGRLGKRADIGLQAIGDRQAGSIVRAAIDA